MIIDIASSLSLTPAFLQKALSLDYEVFFKTPVILFFENTGVTGGTLY